MGRDKNFDIFELFFTHVPEYVSKFPSWGNQTYLCGIIWYNLSLSRFGKFWHIHAMKEEEIPFPTCYLGALLCSLLSQDIVVKRGKRQELYSKFENIAGEISWQKYVHQFFDFFPSLLSSETMFIGKRVEILLESINNDNWPDIFFLRKLYFPTNFATNQVIGFTQ